LFKGLGFLFYKIIFADSLMNIKVKNISGDVRAHLLVIFNSSAIDDFASA